MHRRAAALTCAIALASGTSFAEDGLESLLRENSHVLITLSAAILSQPPDEP